MSNNNYYVYILTNKSRNVLYIGFTGKDLEQRLYEHAMKFVDGFTNKYNTSTLIYYEVYEDAENAILREKQLKRWSREKKFALIKKVNSDLRDLSTRFTRSR